MVHRVLFNGHAWRKATTHTWYIYAIPVTVRMLGHEYTCIFGHYCTVHICTQYIRRPQLINLDAENPYIYLNYYDWFKLVIFSNSFIYSRIYIAVCAYIHASPISCGSSCSLAMRLNWSQKTCGLTPKPCPKVFAHPN